MSYQSMYMYRRAGNTPTQLPLGAYSRGIFDESLPYAIPSYVRAEPDGVDGFGSAFSESTLVFVGSKATEIINMVADALISKAKELISVTGLALPASAASALRSAVSKALQGKVNEKVSSQTALAAMLRSALPTNLLIAEIPGIKIDVAGVVDLVAGVIWSKLFAAPGVPKTTSQPISQAVLPNAGTVKNLMQDPSATNTLWDRVDNLYEADGGAYDTSTGTPSFATLDLKVVPKTSPALIIGAAAAALLALRLLK